MNERIKKLRKALDLTQQEFSNRIGCSRNLVANYETGNRNPSSSVINNICKTFNASEEWLRTGEGEMFLPKADTALELLAAEHNLTEGDRVLIEKFLSLKPEDRRFLVRYVREAAAAIAGQEAAAPALSGATAIISDTSGQARTEMDLVARIAELERQNQKLTAKVEAMEEEDALLKPMDTSKVSPSVSGGTLSPRVKK